MVNNGEFQAKRERLEASLLRLKDYGISLHVNIKEKNSTGDEFEMVSVLYDNDRLIIAPYRGSAHNPLIQGELELKVELPKDLPRVSITRSPNKTSITFLDGSKIKYDFLLNLPKNDTEEGRALCKRLEHNLYIFDLSDILGVVINQAQVSVDERDDIMEIEPKIRGRPSNY